MLEVLQCDLVVICSLLLFELACIVVTCWGLIGAVRFMVARFAGQPLEIRPRRLLVAAAIVLVPLCLYEIVTWHPELSERSLQGHTVSEVIERAGYPSRDSRKDPDSASSDSFHLDYRRGFKCYRVEFLDNRVARVAIHDIDK